MSINLGALRTLVEITGDVTASADGDMEIVVRDTNMTSFRDLDLSVELRQALIAKGWTPPEATR
jgi:hypothetical protein